MKPFNLLISNIFRVGLIYLLVFVWVRFYERNLYLAVLYSALISIILCVFLNLLSQKKFDKTSLKNQEIKRAQNFASQFVFGGKAFAINFFNKLLSKQFAVNKTTNFLWWNNGEETIAFVPMFNAETLKIRDVIFAHNQVIAVKPTKIIIAGVAFDRDTTEFAKTAPINIVLLDQFATYEKLMKPNDCFPDENPQNIASAPNRWAIFLAHALSRKRAKMWAFSGILLIFSSFFVRVSVFYLIISSFMLIMAIVAYSNTKYNTTVPENIF